MRLVSYRTALPRYKVSYLLLRFISAKPYETVQALYQPYIYIISKIFNKIKCKDFSWFLTQPPEPSQLVTFLAGNYSSKVNSLFSAPIIFCYAESRARQSSLLGFRLRKFLNPRDNQTSVGLHNYALVETIGIEPILGGRSLPLSSQRPIPIWSG